MDIATLFIAGSLIVLGPTEYPNAAAQVTFKNSNTNSNYDERDYTLSSYDMTIGVAFQFNVNLAGADAIVVTPPLGWACLPVDCRIEAIEGYEKILYLFPWEGM